MSVLQIGEKTLQSRLLLGTGKYRTPEEQVEAVEASGTGVLTFAVRRIPLDNAREETFQGLDLARYEMLPNTAGADTAEEALRTARLAREAGLCDMIKVEVIGCSETLLPDPVETIKATRMLVEDGFTVLTYTSDDVVLAKRVQEAGCHAVMPAAAPIGSGLGIVNPYNLKQIIAQAQVPVIVDAGIGTPSHAAQAMEMGADGVLLNSAVAGAGDPEKMAEAMKAAVTAGRLAFESGPIPPRDTAFASSPQTGVSRPS
ncbi:thiazole synthase [Alkalicoccus urumqiensis]|uniref:Thiazole synthase n=1 Tax=Alkalicoccus urumqiensis TaxID=1548213 RepID=A0A2P6MHI9_ALKUR|nr:thiazole synthase [Alkalicoccus urumqiensis]PRO65728.1 thiazole synthase [Alkalicoccus urumqiensis]